MKFWHSLLCVLPRRPLLLNFHTPDVQKLLAIFPNSSLVLKPYFLYPSTRTNIQNVLQ
ncbi:MAG: hypothetical protein GY795_06020 [Desulfobacterales bacterium]|nr:hypothetical protein [Desulfobacterales bacterium]